MNSRICCDHFAGIIGNFLEDCDNASFDLLSSIQVCQQKLTYFAQSTSKTDFLEQILRIFQKAIKFCFLLQVKGEEAFRLNKCSIQIRKSIEILGVFQGIHLIEEFACPNAQGLYLIQRASLQKSLSRVFLFAYNFLSNLKLAENLDLIHLPKITQIAIGQCSLLRLAIDISYLFYRLLVISEGIQAKKLSQVAISVSKVFTVASSLILRMLNAQPTFFVLALTSVSILTDLGSLAKKEKWI